MFPPLFSVLITSFLCASRHSFLSFIIFFLHSCFVVLVGLFFFFLRFVCVVNCASFRELSSSASLSSRCQPIVSLQLELRTSVKMSLVMSPRAGPQHVAHAVLSQRFAHQRVRISLMTAGHPDKASYAQIKQGERRLTVCVWRVGVDNPIWQYCRLVSICLQSSVSFCPRDINITTPETLNRLPFEYIQSNLKRK